MQQIDPRRTYALILGGGAGKRLFPLTTDRAKPAVPLAGKYRLIDVPISNCINSNITHIFVLTQYNSKSLHRHIQQTYHFDRFSRDFVDILAAEQTMGNMEWYQGTADAVRRNLWHLNDPNFSHVLVLSGDQIYRMDLRNILDTHARTEADVTLAVTPKRPEEAREFGVLKINAQFQVIDFIEKPTPAQMEELVIRGEDLAPLGISVHGPVVLASMGIYAFAKDRLQTALDTQMEDFGKHIIPWCVQHMRVFVHPFLGYWEDVGTIRSYFQANLDLTSWAPSFNFYNEAEPVYSHPRFLPNSMLDEVLISRSMISDGCFIREAVIKHSAIGVRSVIRRGSILDEVVMLGQDHYDITNDCLTLVSAGVCQDDIMDLSPRGVGQRCRISHAILDKNTAIGDDVVISDHTGQPDEDHENYYVRDGIVIVPKNGVIPSGTII